MDNAISCHVDKTSAMTTYGPHKIYQNYLKSKRLNLTKINFTKRMIRFFVDLSGVMEIYHFNRLNLFLEKYEIGQCLFYNPIKIP